MICLSAFLIIGSIFCSTQKDYCGLNEIEPIYFDQSEEEHPDHKYPKKAHQYDLSKPDHGFFYNHQKYYVPEDRPWALVPLKE